MNENSSGTDSGNSGENSEPEASVWAHFSANKRAFLAAYLATGGNVKRASEAAQIDRTRHYHWLKEDAAYAEAFAETKEQAADTLEDEATRRAVEGTEKPVYQGGQSVGTVREYSDTLLMFLLRAQRPRKYRERASVEVSGEVDKETQSLLMQMMTTEEVEAVRDGKRDFASFLPQYRHLIAARLLQSGSGVSGIP